MKPGKFVIPLMLLLFLGATACQAAECPIEVKVSQREGLKIIAIVDTVTIQDVKVNRGNTKVDGLGSLPETLKFGTEKKFIVFTSLDALKEVEVQTNLGNWAFKF